MGILSDQLNELTQRLNVIDSERASLVNRLAELQQLLGRCGAIAGVCFNDDNGDGLRGPRDGLSGQKTIKLRPKNGTGAERLFQTDPTGRFQIEELVEGTYQLTREKFPDGFRLSNHDSGWLDVTVVRQQTTTADIGTARVKQSPPSTTITPAQFASLESGKSYQVAPGEHTLQGVAEIVADDVTVDFADATIITPRQEQLKVTGKRSKLIGGRWKSTSGAAIELRGEGSAVEKATLLSGSAGLVIVRGDRCSVVGCKADGKYSSYLVYGENARDLLVARNNDVHGSTGQSAVRLMGCGGVVEGNTLVGAYKSSALRVHHTTDPTQRYVVRRNTLAGVICVQIGTMSGGDGGERHAMLCVIENSVETWRPVAAGEKDYRGVTYERALADRRQMLAYVFGGAEVYDNDITGQIKFTPLRAEDGEIDLHDNRQHLPTKHQDAVNIAQSQPYPATTLDGDPPKRTLPRGRIANHTITAAPGAKFGWSGKIRREKVTFNGTRVP